ncbi:hypothetical protein G6F70_008361 [Rhizopus microsporus]|uniref:Uncharacterized protein n=1 Tax=Rhizopus microsporus TaxID=58291 RepID=A0A1X0SAH0_RHIZD|nr:hypothetical protein G6F71_008454 [Rhizopus microsporus]KAG1195274.1 hypothetical protein G6F70_008361 [Rhizopus microsporus]KAG1207069.1 hypothetical protein G6F69_008337 [Rhizopus microsporus]KAG1227712.1 hypothetical protein G6F67_008284 [Rhizopus microsporus]KAG1259628.1 hypothetical protein G6F68_007986 [Rhizopus microsporus]
MAIDLIDAFKKTFEYDPSTVWVAYENGTLIFFKANTDKQTAIENAQELVAIDVTAGTDTADFDVYRMDKAYPDDNVYLVAYSNPSNMVTILEMPEGSEDLIVGLSGRAKRIQDSQSKNIICTSFD